VGKALQMSKDSLAQAIKTLVPSKAIDINLRALDAGWDFMD